jgi:hypothetical protein
MASVMTAILPSGFMHYTTAVSRGMSDDPKIMLVLQVCALCLQKEAESCLLEKEKRLIIK